MTDYIRPPQLRLKRPRQRSNLVAPTHGLAVGDAVRNWMPVFGEEAQEAGLDEEIRGAGIGDVQMATSLWGGGTIVLRDDGTVWGWGYLGPGGIQSKYDSAPNDDYWGVGGPAWYWRDYVYVATPIAHMTNVQKIFAGSEGFYALKNDGTLWFWGASEFWSPDSSGDEPDMPLTPITGPVQLGPHTNIVDVQPVSWNGAEPACVYRTADSKVWGIGWGYPNLYGIDTGYPDPDGPHEEWWHNDEAATAWWGEHPYEAYPTAPGMTPMELTSFFPANIASWSGYEQSFSLLTTSGEVWSWASESYALKEWPNPGLFWDYPNPKPWPMPSFGSGNTRVHNNYNSIKVEVGDGTHKVAGLESAANLGYAPSTYGYRNCSTQFDPQIPNCAYYIRYAQTALDGRTGSPRGGIDRLSVSCNVIARKTDGSFEGWGISRYGDLGHPWYPEYSSLDPIQWTWGEPLFEGLETTGAFRADCTGSMSRIIGPNCVPWHQGGNGSLEALAHPHLDDLQPAYSSSGPPPPQAFHTKIGVPVDARKMEDVDVIWEPEFTNPTISGQGISAGREHSLAVTPAGGVLGWGKNENFAIGQDGDGQTYANPVGIDGISSVQAVSAGDNHSLALRTNGTVWAWGSNVDGKLGTTLAVNSTTPDPAQVQGLTSVVKISAGYKHSLALKSNGTVWAWGDGAQSALGLGGDTADKSAPVQVPGLSNIVDIAAGNGYSLAVAQDGTGYAWGTNSAGQLGTGDTSTQASPIAVFADVTQCRAGFQTSAWLGTDGVVWVSGDGSSGQLGDGTQNNALVPTDVTLSGDATEIAVGTATIMAKLTNGEVWSWGGTTSGEQADGASSLNLVPAKSQVQDEATIDLGIGHGLAIYADNTLWAWGLGATGQIGDGSATSRLSPVQVLGATVLSNEPITEQFDCCGFLDRGGADDEPGGGEDPGGGGGPTTEPEPEPLPPMEPDPTSNPLNPQPFTPPNANQAFEPDAPPRFEGEFPLDDPPEVGDDFEFEPPDFDPLIDEPFVFPIDEIEFEFPDLDPCNFNMPSFSGDLCGGGKTGDRDGGGLSGGGGGGGGSGTGGGGGVIGGGNGGLGSAPTISKYFAERRCYTSTLVTEIMTDLCEELGLDPEKLVIDPEGEPCEEEFTGCFEKGTNKFDALKHLAHICGYGIIDDGSGVIILPPEPRDRHHYMHEDTNVFHFQRVYSDIDLFEQVEVFRPPRYSGGRIVVPGVSKFAYVNTVFEVEEDTIKQIPTYDYNLSETQIQNLANWHAANMSGMGGRCQIDTLYNKKYELLDQIHVQRPSLNWYTRWMIRSIEHSFNEDGYLTIMQATILGNDPPEGDPSLPDPVPDF